MAYLSAFASAPRGLEPILAEELAAVGASDVTVRPGGVSFAGDALVVARANLMSRVATRVMVKVAEAPVATLSRSGREGEALYRLGRDVPWHRYLTPDDRLRVDVAVARERLADTVPFLTLRVKDAVCDAARAYYGRRPSVDKISPTVRVVAFLDDRVATLYWDTSGVALTRRGFKGAATAAPLKENLAAGILRLIGWEPRLPLVDPMCGSGTFVLEAALLAYGVPPGLFRSFAFERWSELDQTAWRAIRDEARREVAARVKSGAAPLLFASDRDARQVLGAQRNWGELEAALGVTVPVVWAVSPAEELLLPEVPSPGFWLANPPYGVRLALEERTAWYRALGSILKHRWAGWRAHLFTGDPALVKSIGLRPAAKWQLMNGAIPCALLSYPLVAGSAKGALALRDRAEARS